MKQMKDSGIEWIGRIPEDWELTTYRRVFNRRKEYDDKDKQVLSLTIQGVKEKNENYGKMAEDFTGHQIVKKNDLVFTPRDFDATPILSGIAPCDGCISNLYFVLYPHDTSNTHIPFYNYFMWGVKWGGDIWRKLSYGMRFSYNFQQFGALPTVIPPIDTQKRIADYLDEKCGMIDRYIEKQQQVIEKLKAYKQSVITEAVTKGINPDVPMKDSGIEWIGMIPEHWGVCKFGYLATVKSNLVHPNEYKSYPQVSSENIEKGSGKLLECHTVDEVGIISDNHLFFKGQILYSKIRPALNKATIAPFDGLCSADIYPIETKECLKFVLYSILSESFLEQVRTITETRVKMPKINQNELSGIWLTKIPYDEQQAIATYLDSLCESIDKAIANKEKIVRKVIEYKKSLIYEVVTGKLEV